MKILLMGFTKIKYMPYANFYLDCIDCEKNDVHLLYWNRDEQTDIIPPQKLTLHEFSQPQQNEVKKYKKFGSFFKYRKFAKALLAKESFDFIIVMHTLPGVLVKSVLKKRYNKKFILDYRDLTYEKYGFFKKAVAELVNVSVATFVSSDKFRDVLPQAENIYTSHNIDPQALPFRENRRALSRAVSPVKISFWGFIRHIPLNLALLDAFGNDSRFELHYYGKEQATAAAMREHIAKNKLTNVFFHGEYRPEERYEFVKKTDIIHNLYNVENDGIRAAMGNKYYDAVMFYLPLLCNEGVYMGERAEKAGTGLCVDVTQQGLADRVYDYYKNINWREFEACCDCEVAKFMAEYNSGRELIEKAINGGNSR